MEQRALRTDVAIIGGGIAGLWALDLLRDRGYSALLFERDALGSQQTINSQGMIHGGVKYALGGRLTPGSEAIAAMPGMWRSCLAGTGPVDLRGCKLLSDSLYLWSSANLGSRLSGFFASKLLRGRVHSLEPADFPRPLQAGAFTGQVYRLAELVLDVPSLLGTLAERHAQAIFTVDWQASELRCEAGRASLVLPGLTLEPECLLLCAGAGNQVLLDSLGATGPAMQRRPLQQVLVKHQYTEPFFAHCLGTGTGPRLTITSHRAGDGAPVWYLGGELATRGADWEPEPLIERAREELRELLPWLDLGESAWRTVRLDRAEPEQASLLRPDTAFVGDVAGVDNALAAWPTKLTLTPRLGELVLDRMAQRQLQPRHRPDLAPLAALPRPVIAAPEWETLFQ